MNSKERVAASFNHIKPDRVPLDGWFTNAAMDNLKKYYKTEDEELILDKLGIDFRPVVLEPDPEFSSQAKWMDFVVNKSSFSISDYIGKPVGGNIYEDEWGVQIKQSDDGVNWGYCLHPLSDLDLDKLKVPNLKNPKRMDNVKYRIEKFKDKFVYAGVSTSFRRGWLLTGFSKFLETLLLDRNYIDKLLERLVEFEILEVNKYADTGVDMIQLLGDLGTEISLFISPALWREIFKPKMKAVIDSVKGKNIYFFLHTDGNIMEIIPDLIEIGINILNPIQPECIDPAEIKKLYGDKITLHGTMSLQKTLSFGSVQDTINEVKDRVENCGQNGGLVLAPSNALTKNIPVENITAFYEYVKSGKY